MFYTMTTWLRPTCTLLIKRLVSCNSAAYHVNLAVESTCQGTDHILGKCYHLRAVAMMEDKPLRIDGLKDLLQMIWREDMFVKNLQHSSRTGQHIHEGRLLSSRRHTVIRCVSDCPFPRVKLYTGTGTSLSHMIFTKPLLALMHVNLEAVSWQNPYS